MAKKKQSTRKRTPSVVPRPPPRAVTVAKKSQKPSVSTRARAQIAELTEELEKKETKVLHVAAGVGGTIGCTLTGALIVSKGWMGAKWASALLTTVGAGTTFAGWRYDRPLLMWTGAGWTFAGAAHGTMAVVVDARRAAQEDKAQKDKKGKKKTRNATSEYDRLPTGMERKLLLSERRATELERELARARRRLNPELELAAA